MKRIALSACCFAALSLCSVAFAQGTKKPEAPAAAEPGALELSLEQALRLARQSSPTALATPLRIKEAEAARVEANIYPRYNPLLEVEVGPRLIETNPESVFFSVGLSQNLDLGGGVGARQRRVDAQVEAALGDGDAAIQQTQRAVALAFLRGLWAEQRAALAGESEGIAKAALDATKKRLDAGDATALELNVARGGFARAVADRTGADATLEATKGELRALLGLPSSTSIDLLGSLAAPLAIDLPALRKAAQGRGDLRALAADLAVAEAEDDLADALAAPQMSLGARYELEDKVQHTILGTLTMTLPIFDHAQGLAAQAEAKAARAKTELDAKKTQVATEVETAAKVAAKRADAANAFAAEKGAESFEENLALAIKGYQAGETSLADLLLVRRELVETEGARIDRLLELRSSEVELLYAAGMLP
ncbi:MAG: TolC family protein [Polyangiaceae bacterium]|nr:TolC family protein [Polyangiaceae bacterium]